MKLKSVEIENYRAIEQLKLRLDPQLTVFHGANGYGKTSVLSAIAVGLGAIPKLLSDVSDLDFCEEDQREDDVSDLDFCEEDQREGAGAPRVSTTDMDGTSWERQGGRQGDGQMQRMIALGRFLDRQSKDPKPDEADLPIVAFYSTDRIVSGLSKVPDDPKVKFPRFAALKGALDARTDFGGLFTWFYFKEDEELRRQKERRDFNYQLKDISAVRQAISSMLPEVFDPRTELNPPRFVVSQKSDQGQVEKLSLDQLSGGYRIVLALAADLARRMAQGNPHRQKPLESEAIVLIDEIELHLHPSWQQRILGDLRRTFPNAQFIVSTHSPQVLTTVEPQHIVELYRDGDRIVAGAPGGATYGAEAGDVLSVVMGVDERPPENRFTKALDQYRRLIREGRWESKEALALRESLESMSPDDPALDRADLEIKRRKLFKQRAESR